MVDDGVVGPGGRVGVRCEVVPMGHVGEVCPEPACPSGGCGPSMATPLAKCGPNGLWLWVVFVGGGVAMPFR